MGKKNIIYLILVIIWMGVIYIYSDMKSDKSNNESISIVNSVVDKIDSITNATDEKINHHQDNLFIMNTNAIFRKICHGIVYMALSVLVFNFLIRIMKSRLLIYNILTLLICFVYASIDEYHQTFVAGRMGSFTDVLIDTFGALIGCLFVSIIYCIVKRKRNSYE